MQLMALMVSSKKGHCYFQKGGFFMKSIAGVLAVTLNLLTLTLIWGFSYLHAYTDALAGSFMPEEYRYLPIPLIVVIIASMILELALIYRQELSVYFRSNNKEK